MEFKEILSYTKKWWWLVLLLAIGGGFLSYWLYDMLPNQRAKTTWSSASRFATPSDSLRVITHGKNVSRFRFDINTERFAVNSDDNQDRAAHYYAVIQAAIDAGTFATAGGESVFESDTYRNFLLDLQTLAGEPMVRKVDEYNPKSLRVKIGERAPAPTNFAAEPLASLLSAARDRVKGLGIKAEAIPPQSRFVEIQISGATSETEARIWADATVLAAIRESFKRHIHAFESQIKREAELRDARHEKLDAATESSLQLSAQERLMAVEKLTPLDASVDIAAQARELGTNPITIPDFKEFNADIERLVYYGQLKKLIETPTVIDGVDRNYGDLVGAISSRVPWDIELRNEIRDLNARKGVFEASKVSPESLLEGTIHADEELLVKEKERFEALVATNDAAALEAFQPNQGVVWSSQIANARLEIVTLNRSLARRLQAYTEEELEVQNLRRQKSLALDNWKRSIEDAIVAKETNLRNDRTLAESKLAKYQEKLVSIDAALADARLLLNRYNTVAGLYNSATSEISAANDRIQAENQRIAEYERDLNGQTAVLRAEAFSTPGIATETKSNRLPMSVIVGLIILIGSSVIIYVMMLARNKISNEYDIRRHVNLPVLAKMAKRPIGEKSLLTISPRSAAAEAYSTLATQVRSYARELSLRSILVTSAVKSEGKTDVVCNLSVALARKGLSVLVIDTDLHRPRVAEFFGVTTGTGLVHYAQAPEDRDIIDYVIPTYQGGPDLMLPGGEVQDPVRLLESDAFKAMLKQAEREYDIVLFDSPPVARVGDALIVGAETDATLMVCSAGVVTFADAALAKRLLTNIQANLLGVVLNNATDISAREYYNYYSYGDRTRRRVREVFD